MERPLKRSNLTLSLEDKFYFPVELWSEVLKQIVISKNNFLSLVLTCKTVYEQVLAFCNLSKVTLQLTESICKSGNTDALLWLMRNPTAAVNHQILIDIASIVGRHEIVDLLLQSTFLDPSINDNKLMEIACKNSDPNLMQVLLKYPIVSPSINNNEPFQMACILNAPDLIRRLLQDKRVNPTDLNNRALLKSTHVDVLKILWELPEIDFSFKKNKVFTNACKRGDVESVKWLLSNSTKTPHRNKVSQNTHRFLTRQSQLAVECRKPQKRLVNPTDNQNKALNIACAKGHLEIVELLLSHPSIDPSENNNRALIEAVIHKQIHIVSLLLTCVDPSVDHCSILSEYSTTNYDVDILAMLINDSRIDPNAIHFIKKEPTSGLLTAVLNLDAPAIEVYMKHPRVNVAIKDFQVVRVFIDCINKTENNNNNKLFSVFKLLVSDPRIDLSIDSDFLLLTICSKPLPQLLEILVQDSRVTCHFEGLKEAIKAKIDENIPILIFSKKINSEQMQIAFSLAIQENNLAAVKILAPNVTLGNSEMIEASIAGFESIVQYLIEFYNPEFNFEDAIYATQNWETVQLFLSLVPKEMRESMQKYVNSRNYERSPIAPDTPIYFPFSPDFQRQFDSNQYVDSYAPYSYTPTSPVYPTQLDLKIVDPTLYYFCHKDQIPPPYGAEQPWHKVGAAVVYEGQKANITAVYVHARIRMCEIQVNENRLDVPLYNVAPNMVRNRDIVALIEGAYAGMKGVVIGIDQNDAIVKLLDDNNIVIVEMQNLVTISSKE